VVVEKREKSSLDPGIRKKRGGKEDGKRREKKGGGSRGRRELTIWSRLALTTI